MKNYINYHNSDEPKLPEYSRLNWLRLASTITAILFIVCIISVVIATVGIFLCVTVVYFNEQGPFPEFTTLDIAVCALAVLIFAILSVTFWTLLTKLRTKLKHAKSYLSEITECQLGQ